MTDGGSRRAGPWPLLAMTLLVLLLAVFLFIRWQRRDTGPAVVKEAVPVPVSRGPVVAPTPGQPASTPVVPQKDPKEETYKERVHDAEVAIEAKHWIDAEDAVKKAREIFDRPELKTLLERVAKGRDDEEAVAKAEIEARRRQEAKWIQTSQREREDREKNLYDDAWNALEALAREFPKILEDQRFIDVRKHLRLVREDADTLNTQYMASARKAFAEERFSDAILWAKRAGDLYPERMAAVKEFQDRVNDLLLRKTMVRVACNVPCTIGSEDPKDENPVRVMTLQPFYIDKYEVTNEEYLGFVTASGHAPPPTTKNVPPVWYLGKPVPGKEKHPVVNVSYADAEAYAAWAGKRLPTADEWEVAARGPDKREYPWGNAFTEKENVFHCNCVEYWQLTKTLYGTMPVDAFDGANSASFYGVYGMGGNAWEWTSTSVMRTVAGKAEDFRVLKGGSFMTPAKAIRCATVYPEDPTLGHPDVGFRCVRDVK